MIAEYGAVENEERSKRTVLEQRTRNGRTYELVHKSPGWTTAGSMARMRETECWSVLFMLGGAENGRSFGTLREAMEMLDKWTSQ